jgi:lytic murein transglycosylase
MRRLWLACGAAAVLAASPGGAVAQEAQPLSACIASLRKELRAHPEVSAQTFDTYTREVQDLRPVIESASQAQPEFVIPIWDYLARRVDAQRIAEGRDLMRQQGDALADIARRHRVDPATTVAVLGIETNYGSVSGRYPVVDATLSRACLNLNSSERKQHFFDALWLLQEGTVRPETFRGSWAGAFGMTQFMPGTFRRYMRDGPDSPPADIVGSMADALATTARYLRGLGWTEGLPWGVEVRVPPELARLNAQEGGHGCLAGPRSAGGRCRSAGEWGRAGVTRVDGSPLVQRDPAAGLVDAATTAALLMPAGPQGPVWLVTPNYQAIWRYNRADTYALAIGLLSDALRGMPPPQVAWPTDDPGLSRAEFRQLQQLLVHGGHCDVLVDGAEGPRTGAAIRAEEGRLGWPVTGRAGSKLLAALAAGRADAAACPPNR